MDVVSDNNRYCCPNSLDPEALGPVEVLYPHALTPAIFVSDHAGNAVPSDMKKLGLPEKELERHIAWDIGADALSRLIARRFKATTILARYSRLIIDANRALGDPEAIPDVSDGTVIPANISMTENERLRRAELFYWPYHNRIAAELGRLRSFGSVPALIALHTFTPSINGAARPWHVGVLWNERDGRIARPLMDRLAKVEGLSVGDNQPYSGVTHGYSLRLHGDAQGLAHVEIEVRQDLVCDGVGQERWARILGEALTPILDDPTVHSISFS